MTGATLVSVPDKPNTVQNGVYTIELDGTSPQPQKALHKTEKPDYETVVISKDDNVKSDNKEDDPWALPDISVQTTPWTELSTRGKTKRVLWDYIFRQVVLVSLLYLFICSLDFLSSAFRLLGGKTAGEIFKGNVVLSNPMAGVMIGILVTVLVQSSSTSTSIIVSMVGANILDVKLAIPIIMGTNIGTSVTNTIVSLGQAGDRNQFRRAFGGATVHDMFNWLSVIIFLPLEIASGYLFYLTETIVDTFDLQTYEDGDVKLLKYLTEPFTHYVMKIDNDVIKAIARNASTVNQSLILVDCNGEPCQFLFMDVANVWEDWIIGLILLAIALVILCTCLVLIVKLLHSIFQGKIASLLKKFVNANFPGRCGKYGTGYLAILMGALLTILVQSSSIFTCTLTPLVGLGVLSLDRMYPLTLGSNIGTTFTAILSSLANEGDQLGHSIQISLCHLFFNISGIILWYPIPIMRKLPILLAKKLGNTTAKYRWFAILYLIVMFFVLPAAVFGLSILGWEVLAGVGIPVVVLLIIILIINILQNEKPFWLPVGLRTWEFLPLCLHSLSPLDRVISKVMYSCPCCKRCRRVKDQMTYGDESDTVEASKGEENSF